MVVSNISNITVKEDISCIVETVTSNFPVTKIILFGSQAEGYPRDDSDIDLAIILEKLDRRKIVVVREIRKQISPLISSPVDLLVYEADEFEEKAECRPTLEYKIQKEGIRLYG